MPAWRAFREGRVPEERRNTEHRSRDGLRRSPRPRRAGTRRREISRSSPTIGEVAVGCALGHLDFGCPISGWRTTRPACGRGSRRSRISLRHRHRSGEPGMKINGKPYRTIWPHRRNAASRSSTRRSCRMSSYLTLRGSTTPLRAIKTMIVRGAPLIGATAAYGIALAMRDDPSDESAGPRITTCCGDAADRDQSALGAEAHARRAAQPAARRARRHRLGAKPRRSPTKMSRSADAIGEHGLKILQRACREESRPKLNVLTHCNAGWLGCVDWGTALAPIYMAHDAGIPLHVWVDETRPRNQGASLTAFELGAHGVPHTIIADNAGGHYYAAGRGRSVHRRHRPRHRERRRRQQDRHLSEGARREGQRRAVLCRAAVLDHRLDAGERRATFRSKKDRRTSS